MSRITCDTTTLMRQAHITSSTYLSMAKSDIDSEFGHGYAMKHPELVVAFMNTAAMDFHSAMVRESAQDIAETIERIYEDYTKGYTQEW